MFLCFPEFREEPKKSRSVSCGFGVSAGWKLDNKRISL
ncbi:hypothetical protein C4K10_2722 [Pseudomonas chlororaphis subsp. aureofaciens]|nr:hypothetical protein C4K10_2722 [Pseudomonas chlororaphis subsp. aureofaciens]